MLVVILSLLMIPVRGLILSILWTWFLVDPLGVPDIGVADALGISLIANLLTYSYHPPREEDKIERAVAAILIPFMALGFGFVYHLFQ